MDRRKSLKAIALGTVSTGLLINACKTADKKAGANEPATTINGISRMKEEAANEKEINSKTFLPHRKWQPLQFLETLLYRKMK